MPNAILLISCPDKRGITAAITDFVFRHNGNIEHADQHIDKETNTFFMRIEWSLAGFRIPPERIAVSFEPLRRKFAMRCDIHITNALPRIAIFVSRFTHCLQDIVLRHAEGELPCEIPLIISNHRDAAAIAEQAGIPFFVVPKTAQSKKTAERVERQLCARYQIDTIVLARYMQVLSSACVKQYPNSIINIHHSFLPAFAGGSPYQQAYARGVKIIGATSHYVTAQLDAGPIIEQDTVRITHRESLDDLKRKGKDLEKQVLVRAVRLHLEHKILAYNNKTVIFD